MLKDKQMCRNRWNWTSERCDSRLQPQICWLGDLRGMGSRRRKKEEQEGKKEEEKKKEDEREREGEGEEGVRMRRENKKERREEDVEGEGREEFPPTLKYTMFRVCL